ncbi:hypothetical protein LLG88_08720, partial [bacterium]|nr:hypothetical protein [bacterium]
MTFRCRVRVDGREFDAAIEDLDERPVRVDVEGRMVEVWPEEASAPRRATSSAPRPARDEAPAA